MKRIPFNCVLACALASSAAAASAGDARAYRIGAASVTMTPKVSKDSPPVWLAGYGQGRRAEVVHDDVGARAVFIHDGRFGLAVVSCDLIGLFRDEVMQVRREIAGLQLKPPIDYVLVSSTHTHAGPDTLGLWGSTGRTGITPGYLQQVRAACVEAIRQAHGQARPGSLRIATADVNKYAELIGDSRQPGVIDSQMTVVQAASDAGKVIVTLVNVPCHPEVLGSKNTQLSSDFPSTLRQFLEKRFGGVAIYNSGAIGGLLSPRRPKDDPFTHEPLPEDPIDQMTAYGRIMGHIAEDALAYAQPLEGPIQAASREVLVPVWNPFYKVGASLGVLRRQMFDSGGKLIEPPRGPSSTNPADAPAGPTPHLRTEIGLVQIGPLRIAAVPGELYPELALGRFQRPQDPAADFPGASLEPAIYPSMTARFKMIIGLANDEIGYIIPKSQWDWAAPFAYGRTERQYGEFNSCGPDAAPRLMEAWQALLKDK